MRDLVGTSDEKIEIDLGLLGAVGGGERNDGDVAVHACEEAQVLIVLRIEGLGFRVLVLVIPSSVGF